MNKLFVGLFAMMSASILGAGCAVSPTEVEEMDADMEDVEDVAEAEQALACRPLDGVTCYYSAGSSKANCFCSSAAGCMWLGATCLSAGGSWELYDPTDGLSTYCAGMQNPC